MKRLIIPIIAGLLIAGAVIAGGPYNRVAEGDFSAPTIWKFFDEQNGVTCYTTRANGVGISCLQTR